MEIRYDSSKEAAPIVIDTRAPPVVTPSPTTWPRIAPNMLDIDLVGPRSIIATSDTQYGPKLGGAKWLDGNPGVNGTGDPGYDNTGQVFHYSSLSGIAVPANGPACDMSKGWVNWDCKFTNYNTYPIVKWGVEPSGLHYLESGTDGSKTTTRGEACRLIDFKAGTLGKTGVKEVWWRDMGLACQDMWDHDTEMGIKRSGVGGMLVNGGTFAEIFELGKKTAKGWELQAYRYDGEGDQGVSIFPGVEILPDRWYTFEGHVKVPTTVTATQDPTTGKWTFGGSKDGVIEFKVDGVLVFSRKDVNMGTLLIQGFNELVYHGGTANPSGLMRHRTARIAVSTAGWIGPAPEIAA